MMGGKLKEVEERGVFQDVGEKKEEVLLFKAGFFRKKWESIFLGGGMGGRNIRGGGLFGGEGEFF